MTTPDLASIIDAQEAEIGRLVAELAVVRRDWKADVGTLTAKLQTTEAERARLDKQNWNLCAAINAAEERAQTAEAQRDAYKRAKEENDERFMTERDSNLAALERARALLSDLIIKHTASAHRTEI